MLLWSIGKQQGCLHSECRQHLTSVVPQLAPAQWTAEWQYQVYSRSHEHVLCFVQVLASLMSLRAAVQMS